MFLSVFVAKKQNIRYGTINATKTIRLKGSQRRAFYIFPSVEAWNIDGVKPEITRKQLKTDYPFSSLPNRGDLEGQ